MGVDCGIVVREQILDEKKWRAAMAEIRLWFQGEGYFKVHHKNYVPNLLCGQVLASTLALRNMDAGGIIKKIMQYAQADVCSPERFEYFELTEPSNFGPGADRWRWRCPELDEAELRRRRDEQGHTRAIAESLVVPVTFDTNFQQKCDETKPTRPLTVSECPLFVETVCDPTLSAIALLWPRRRVHAFRLLAHALLRGV